MAQIAEAVFTHGGQAIGEALYAHPKVALCLYGHSHERHGLTRRGVRFVNYCLAGHDATWGVVEIPERRESPGADEARGERAEQR